MDRRAFIGSIAGGILAVPLATGAQLPWARADGGLAPSGKRQSMENRMNGVAGVVSFLIMSLVVPLADAAEPPAWVKQSDENAQIALAVFARYRPESAGQTGVPGLDEDILDLKPAVYDRYLADARQAAADSAGTATCYDRPACPAGPRDSHQSGRRQHHVCPIEATADAGLY